MENLLTGLPGWLLVILAGGYIIRIEIKHKNGEGPPARQELHELISEMRVFVKHMSTWTALSEDRSKRMEICLQDIKDRLSSGKH